jgi:hypothetical protein
VVVLVLAFMWFGCDGVGFTTVVEERKGLLGYEERLAWRRSLQWWLMGGKRWFEVTGLLIDAAQRWVSSMWLLILIRLNLGGFSR